MKKRLEPFLGGPYPLLLEVGQGHGGPREGRVVGSRRAWGWIGIIGGEQFPLEPRVTLMEGAR